MSSEEGGWSLEAHHIHCAILVVIVIVIKRSYNNSLFIPKKLINNDTKLTSRFYKFQFGYILSFLSVMLADWMQGPYVYKLYSSYGFSQKDIALLFVVGFGTAGIFGTFIGSLADKFGRKFMCMMFCVAYILSCVTKHFDNFTILMAGRFLGGIATAILFSAFESWMVTHHHLQSFPNNLLGDTFQLAWGWNSIVAVLSGIITSFFVHLYSDWNLFPLSPQEIAAFDCSAFVLLISFGIIYFNYEENYGNVSDNLNDIIKKTLFKMKNDTKIIVLGIIQSSFEASMYMFVFMWTPALDKSNSYESNKHVIDHGWIFANFMLCCMIGTELYGLLTKKY